MNLILSIYVESIYKEYYLPVLNDSDYELVLRAGEFRLRSDIKLTLESMAGVWRFRPNNTYSVSKDGEPFEGMPLQKGDLIHVKSRDGDALAAMIWSSSSELTAFRKYRILGKKITIGLSSSNAVCYPALRLVSHDHAEISFRAGAAYLRDLSLNGTYLNGQRIVGEVRLNFGDMINVFGLTFIYLGRFLAISWLDYEAMIDPTCLELVPPKVRKPKENDPEQNAKEPEAVPEETLIHIAPRVLPVIHDDTEDIDGVPAKNEGDGKPIWMSIFPPLTMVLPMIVGFLLMTRGIGFGIVISAGSAVVGVFWGIVNYTYAKKDRQAKEKRRQERYEEYLVECTDRIREKFEQNTQALQYMYPDADECAEKVMNVTGLWERTRLYEDFLQVRIGLGEMPFQVNINIPRQGFTLSDDELSERPARIAESYRTLRDVPINVDLMQHRLVGILAGGDKAQALEITRLLITQIASNHCYTDVKLAFLYHGDQDTAAFWDYVRWLPHVWNEEHDLRYVACDETGTNEVLYALTQMLRSRAEQLGSTMVQEPVFTPHYVLFVDDPKLLESQMISKYLVDDAGKLGITTVMVADSYELLPNACDFVIEKSSAFQGVYGTRAGVQNRLEVQFDRLSLTKADLMARKMSAMRVNQLESGSDIPSTLTFFELLGVRFPNQLDVQDHWRKNRTYETMRAPIGQKMGGQVCFLDINEKYHGPHGLVAGTTGSGKSETLQTYILSLALNYSPQDVGFFIIDFKGGGMANLFSNLPHLIGQISNLSGNQVRRAMVSIKSENQRRQRIFGEYGVNHIDAYTKLVKNREASVPIPHLLIIIDEFAELKREQPEFMRELISVSQVGRSLGVHLILSTQKPSGTVDENIWSNTKFKLCLRVADKQDSNDMLHRPDAAFLTQAGRGYLQVGNDEIFELFQSGWSGAVYDESGQSVRSSASLLDLQGQAPVSVSRSKSEHLRRQLKEWITKLVIVVKGVAEQEGVRQPLRSIPQEQRVHLAKRAVALLNSKEPVFTDSSSNLRRLEEMISLLPDNLNNPNKVSEYLIEVFQRQGKKLPERQERTQLDAIVSYLAEMAKQTGLVNEQKLWMPLLPEHLDLASLDGYSQVAFNNGWMPHSSEFTLEAYLGLVDDPEHQQQFPIKLDLVDKGHLAVIGSVSSGKSTLLQTLIYSLISTYSPAELNVYAIDYSSQMLCVFEGDVHVGGVVTESQDEKLEKLFILLGDILQERKSLIRGGSFAQYVRVAQEPLPAIVLAIDGYANFNEKTEGRFENQLLELSRTAEGYGIYLVISCGGYGSGELQTKIAANMRQAICLELGDKYLYGDALHTIHFDVLPEQNVKGRGLALVDGSVLEYQAALAMDEENDYERGELIKKRCQSMSSYWTGTRAAPIPAIPEKPDWDEFCTLPAYRSILRSGSALPVAYYKETAAIYSIDLRRTFCYFILGSDRSGKSVFLRDIMCAAADLGGEQYLIDMGNTDGLSAVRTGAKHVTDSDGLVALVRMLVNATNERGALRKALRSDGLDDEEIHDQIAAKYPPLFFFIADLKAMLDAVYKRIEGVGLMSPLFENIFEKGQSLNVFFFAAASISSIPMMMDKAAYLSFIKERRGALPGLELSRQSVFSYQNIRYSEQGKRFRPGVCYATNQEDEQNVDLIVIPNNRRKRVDG